MLTTVGSSPAASTTGGYALAIAKALDAKGADRKLVFQIAGMSPHQSNDPLQRLTADAVNRLYAAAVQVTGDPYFGLAVAGALQVSNLHALGHAIAASDTLLDVCRRVERYFRMISEAVTTTLDEQDGDVRLAFVHRAELRGETEDAFLGFLIVVMRQLSTDGFAPLRVAFRHPPVGPDSAPYESHFRAPITFNQPASMLVFAKDSLLAPLAGAVPELAQMNDALATRYLARLEKDDVVSRARQAILELLPSGHCSRETVARAMNKSAATLRFRLAKQGVNFQDLMDDTRRDLAISYARQSALSVTEIAFLLGFNNTSNFTRAFKRWTGQSPTGFRDAAEGAKTPLLSPIHAID